jgi:hypothetical protein
MATLILPSIEVLNAKQKRLAQLEVRAAIYGIDAPAEVTTEIKDLQREIASVGPTTVAESHDVLFTKLEHIQADVWRLYWLMPVLLLIVVLAIKL